MDTPSGTFIGSGSIGNGYTSSGSTGSGSISSGSAFKMKTVVFGVTMVPFCVILFAPLESPERKDYFRGMQNIVFKTYVQKRCHAGWVLEKQLSERSMNVVPGSQDHHMDQNWVANPLEHLQDPFTRS